MGNFLSDTKRRSGLVLFVFFALSTIISIYLVYYSAIIPGLSSEGDKLKISVKKEEERSKTIEGSFIDSTGEIITHAEEYGKNGKCEHLSYSQLIGYYRTSENKRYGLRKKYSDYLYKGDKNHHGANIQLTTINKVQDAAYEAIRGTEGCVVIIENKTGRIIALATAFPDVEMNINDIDSNWNEMNSNTHSGFLQQNWYKKLAPGSVIKPLNATLVYDMGMANTVYYDDGTERIDGFSFHNSGRARNGNITLRNAIVKSCNTYFAHMANEVGPVKLQNRMEALYIGKPLMLDFATIESAHNLTSSNQTEVASAGFGQGKLLLTPINIAMIGQAIANRGEVLKPYLIDSIFYEDQVIAKGHTESLGRLCSVEAADYVSNAMLDAAESYGISRKRGIHAKTGTADVGNSNRASFLSFNDKYTVCIVENNTNKFGKKLKPQVLKLYDLLEDL